MIKCLLAFPLLILCIHQSAAEEGDIEGVIWTQEEEASLLTPDQHKVAFRDVVLEKVLTRLIQSVLENSRVGPQFTRLPIELIVPDPLVLQDISFQRAQSGLFDINFKAWNLLLSGLQSFRVKNLHVLRHLGLNDVRVVVQLETTLDLEGSYALEGTGLSLLPLSGNGSLNIKIEDFLITGEEYLVLKDNKLYIREPDIQTTDQDLNVNLENLMGAGLVGDVANSILESVGEDLLFNNRNLLSELLIGKVYKIVNDFLNA